MVSKIPYISESGGAKSREVKESHKRAKAENFNVAQLVLKKTIPVNFAKFLRTPFLQNTSGRLLLAFYLLKLIGYLPL